MDSKREACLVTIQDRVIGEKEYHDASDLILTPQKCACAAV